MTIYEFAKQVGLSVATVSKAFNNYPDVSERTKNRVLQEARNIGFEPNLAAQTLTTKRSYLIGVIYNESTGEGLTHPHFSEILEHFKRTMEQNGYQIMFLSTLPDDSNRSIVQKCRYRGLDGVLVMAGDPSSEEFTELWSSGIPTVLVDFEWERQSSALCDNRMGMELIAEYLTALGHREFMYLTNPRTHPSAVDRLPALREALSARGIALAEDRIIGGTGYSFDDGYNAIVSNLPLPSEVTAVITAYDRLAFGAMHALREHGYRIPDDISITGFDNLMSEQMEFWNLTTVEQPRSEIGREAARLMLARIADSDSTERLRLPLRLIERGSCRKV